MFSAFVSDIDSGIECIFSKCEDDTKMSGAVDTPEGRMPSRGTWTGSRSGHMLTS